MDVRIQENYINKLLAYNSTPDWLTKFKEYKSQIMPSKIYRYYSPKKYNFQAFNENYIWASSPEKFNDVYDCIANANSDILLLYNILNNNWFKNNPFSKDEIKFLLIICKQIKEGLSLEDFVSKLKSNLILHDKLFYSDAFCSYEDTYNCFKIHSSHLEPNILQHVKCYATCFSETYDNILMWSHYGVYNTGFCVEYDLTVKNKFTEKLYPILYVEEPVFCPKLMNDIVDGKADLTIAQTLFSTIKYKIWEYEKEWRFFNSKTSHKFYMPENPSCIYLGANITHGNKLKLSKIANRKNIPVKLMYPKEDSFVLEACEL